MHTVDLRRVAIFAFAALCGAVWVFATGCDSSMTSSLLGRDAVANGNTSESPSNAGSNPAAFGAPAAPAANELAAADSGDAAAAAREIEEADLVKVVGDKIFVLNAQKGLIIVGASDPAHPTILGSVALGGQPVEMIVDAARAYIVLNSDYGYYGYPGVATDVSVSALPPYLPPADFDGSRVAIVDISDSAHPSVKGKIGLSGYASQSRRVGNVLYIAGQNLPSYDNKAAEPGDPASPVSYYSEDRAFIASINVADPANIQPVERKTFKGGAVNIHVSENAIYAASDLYDFNAGRPYTRVQYADISDPAGAIVLRGTVDVPGSIRNRFYMDAYAGTFRMCTESWGFDYRRVRLFTYDISNPDAIKALGNTEIIRDESLEAVRFDGPRAYAVTFLRIDPLFVVDLSNPATPVVTGKLEVPGYSTHIDPRGNRLIAIGIDDTAGQRPAVAYYDVSNPQNPSQLGRVVLGPPDSFTDSDAVYDEKAYKIVDDLGLILIPFSHADFDNMVFLEEDDAPPPNALPPDIAVGGPIAPGVVPISNRTPIARPKCVNAVQLVDFNDSELTPRGWFDTRSRAQRVGVVGDRVFAVSQASLQTYDIADRDNPTAGGEAPFYSSDEMANYDFGCGYAFYGSDVIDPVVQDSGWFSPISAMLSQFMKGNGQNCGTMTALPGVLMIVGMMFMKTGSRRRRRRR